ncbi:MAG: hypothetical protein BWK78_05895 [Thiotrichaceae bacterium IS1]|nr:MAG: hypothetical protein BWK78_05895 [Thiotrichaceae bacterium IS1]
MKVFVYSTDKPVPFSEPYKKLIKEIIISNDKQYLDKFVESKDRLMRIVSEEAVCFVPVVVGDIFLGWLREKKYTLEKLTTSALPACEILGNDEFNNWFKNSVNVEEEWEDIKVSSLQSTTVKYEDSAVKVETTTEEVVEPKVYSCSESLITLIILISDGLGKLFASLKATLLQPIKFAVTFVIVLVVLIFTLRGLQIHEVNNTVSSAKTQWEAGEFERACEVVANLERSTMEGRTILEACKERKKAMELTGEAHNNVNQLWCYKVEQGKSLSWISQTFKVTKIDIREKNKNVWDSNRINNQCREWPNTSSSIRENWLLVISTTQQNDLIECPDEVRTLYETQRCPP